MKYYVVVVLYNIQVKKSKTLNSISEIFGQLPDLLQDFEFLIFDNGPEDQAGSFSLPFTNTYECNNSNPGMAAAYNFALENASARNSKWILLLDQDTWVTSSFFNSLIDGCSLGISSNEIVAVVPKMIFQGHFFSPSKVILGGIHRPIDISFFGVYKKNVFAVASASAIRVDFLKSIGGFNKLFWLDCLDRWLFQRIFTENKKVLIIDAFLEHELSVLDYNNLMNVERYINILSAETLFMRLNKSKFENLIYFFRLILRIFVLFFKVKNKKFSFLTFKHLYKFFSDIENAKSF